MVASECRALAVRNPVLAKGEDTSRFHIRRAARRRNGKDHRTKGDQLDNNPDTAYGREVPDFLSGHFRWDETAPVGELELVKSKGETVRGTLVLISEWKTKLPEYLWLDPTRQ